jgi:hypothetical protein
MTTEKEETEVCTVQWQHEDELPDVSDEQFKIMFRASRVDAVRLFPYIKTKSGEKIYIGIP